MNTTTFVNLAAEPAAAVVDSVFPTLQVLGATVCAGLATVLVWGWPRKVSGAGRGGCSDDLIEEADVSLACRRRVTSRRALVRIA